jgi:uncharacterized membrane protein YecN with MAPEG domain
LLHLRVVVGVVGIVVLAICSLTIALIVPRVHHLRNFWEERYKFSRIGLKPKLYAVIFLSLYLKYEVMEKVPKHPITHIEHSQAR